MFLAAQGLTHHEPTRIIQKYVSLLTQLPKVMAQRKLILTVPSVEIQKSMLTFFSFSVYHSNIYQT